MDVKNGSYAITEQGDLGLGLTPVDESVIKEQKEKEETSDKQKLFGFD